MTNIHTPTDTDGFKQQARRLRADLCASGTVISHSRALELIAHQNGARDWNTLCAGARRPRAFEVGDRVRGRYLGQAFAGQILALATLADGHWRRITLRFDAPVDVVRFESFSSLRQRVTGVIGWDGRSPRKTSDGVAQLIVEHCPK